MSETPIQIIDIQEIKGRPRFKLCDELEDILKLAGNHDICLIAITGASRLGKSCFLSYLVHYLRHIETGTTPTKDWLPPNSLTKVLGFPYKNTVERQTTGFWIWPRPFLVPGRTTSKKVAVFVMDTQGVFDEKTMTEWSAIFGLALLTSSILIYNLHFNPQEDSLVILDTFLQYGLMTREQPSSSTAADQEEDDEDCGNDNVAPFQKLFCLIRDWNSEGSYSYGSIGGKQFVDNWISTNNSKLPPDGIQRRNNIRHCFEKVQGCLLPHPGIKAQSDRFEGATADLDQEFYRQIKDCIEKLCSLGNLVPNRIAGRKATFQDLFRQFKNYVNILNRPNTPGAVGYLEATYQASCDGAGENALSHYKNKVEQLTQPKNFISLKQLNLKLDQLEKEAIILFNQKMKLGSPATIKAAKTKLIEAILSAKLNVIQDHTSNFDKILESLTQEAVDKFGIEFQKFCTQSKYDPDIGIPSDKIESILKQVSDSVAESFDSNPALEDDTSKLAETFGTVLDEKLIVLRANFRLKNSKKLEEFEAMITQATSKLVDEYRHQFEDSMTCLPFLEEEKLLQLNSKCRQNILNKLDKLPKNQIPENLRPHARTRLEEKLGQEFIIKSKSNADAISKSKQDLAKLVSGIVDNFKAQFLQHISSSKTTPSQKQLEYEFMKRKGGANDEFLINSPISDMKFTNPYKLILDQQLQQAFHEIVKGIAENQLVLQSQVNNWMESQRSEFKKRVIQHQSQSKATLELADFERVCEKISAIVLANTKFQLKNWGIQEQSQTSTQTTDKLKQILKELSTTLGQEHEGMLQQELSKGRREIDQYVGKYIQLMKSSNLTRSHKSLQSQHHPALTKVKETPVASWVCLPASIRNKLNSDFDREIDNAFQGLQKQIAIEKKEKDEQIQNAVTKAVKLYEDKMNNKWKLDHLDEQELKTQSDSCKKLAQRSFENEIASCMDEMVTEEGRINFGDNIDTLFSENLAKFREKKQSSKQRQIHEIIQSCKNSYSAKMQKSMEGRLGDMVWFTSCHTACQSQIIQNLHQFAKDVGISLTPMEMEKGEDEINTEIQKSQQKFLQQQKDAQASLEDKMEGYIISAIDKHEASIKRIANELLSRDDDILNAAHIQLMDEAGEHLKIHFATIDPSKFANLDQKLTTAFCSNLAKIKENYVKKFIKLEEILANLEVTMNKELEEADDPDWEEISRKHIERRNADFQELDKRCTFPTQDLTTEFKTKYESDTKKLYDDIKTNFKPKDPDPETLNRTLAEMCQLYDEEMNKQFSAGDGSIDANVLRHHHRQVAEYVKERLKERKTIKMTALVKAKLRLKLNALLKKREDANYLNFTTSEVAIGIDLGTTYSCVAIYDKNAPDKTKVLQNALGKATTPSYVRITADEDIVGEPAKEKAYTYPSSTIFDAKRLIGREFNDPLVQGDIRNWPFNVVRDTNGNPLIEVDGRTFEPEAISAKILAKLKKDAEAKLGRPIANAVITVPAYFNDGQRQATKDAGIVAGFKVLELLNEPTAAAVAYSLEYAIDKEQCVLIFDLGGGTFDVAILSIFDANVKNLAVDGDTHLGGEDFDSNLMDYCIQKFSHANPTINVLQGKDSANHTLKEQLNRRLRRLRNACETAKITLSSASATSVALDAFFVQGATALDLDVEVTREEFEKLNEPLFKKCIQIVENTIIAAKVTKENIHEIVLVGGSTRIPKVQEMLSNFFGGRALNKRLNPDEAVAKGAAIRAAVLNGCSELKSTLEDVTPLSIGIKVMGGDLSIIIPRNTTYPTSLTKHYHTVDKDQDEVEIAIYEGEATKATENHLLGTFALTGIPPGPPQTQRVDVTMSVDRDGILTVAAKCEGNGVTKTLTIQEERSRLSEERRELLRARQQTG